MAMLYLRNKPIGAVSGGGSGGGHVIENASGTDLTQRDTLQFSGYLQATDDSTNEKSVVSDAPNEVEYSVWQTMSDAQKAGKKWIIKNVPKTGGTPTDNSVSVTADGVKTLSTLLDELFALVDMSKVGRNTKLIFPDTATINTVFSIMQFTSSDIILTASNAWASANESVLRTFHMTSSGSQYYWSRTNGTVGNGSSNVVDSGLIITLYYNIVATAGIGDITADDVSYESGTVADALDGKVDTTDLKSVAFSGAAADVTYGSGSVKGALDGLTDDIHGIKDSVNVSAENLDTYTAPGVYCVYLTSAVSPLTQGAVYVLEVFGIKFNKTTLGFIQRLTSIYPNDAKIIQRAYYAAVGGWGAWREI